MIFLTAEDTKTALRDSYLDELSDSDQDVIDKAEASAISTMKSHLRQRYDVDRAFSSEAYDDKALVQLYTTYIFIYRLASRIAPSKVSDTIRDNHAEAVAWLEMVSELKAHPKLPAYPTSQKTTNSVFYASPNTKKEHYY